MRGFRVGVVCVFLLAWGVGNPVADELRCNVLKLPAENTTRKVIAPQPSIGEATVYRILAPRSDQKT